MEIPKSFLGYKRENGRAGTRNHVIILPVDDISNACAEAVANNIKEQSHCLTRMDVYSLEQIQNYTLEQ